MTDLIISLEAMIEPIERFFEREYPNSNEMRPELASVDSIDELVYLEKGLNGLHAVRFEEFYDDCILDVSTGIHKLANMPANYHWIALPLDEFRDGEKEFNGIMENETRERGFGIIAVQQKGRGLSAKVIVQPELVEGNFIESYPSLYKKWQEKGRRPGSDEGYRPVEPHY